MAGFYSRRPLQFRERTFAMEETNYCVYKHISPSGKVYIGITSQTQTKGGKTGKDIKETHIFGMRFKSMVGKTLITKYWKAVCQGKVLVRKKKSI